MASGGFLIGDTRMRRVVSDWCCEDDEAAQIWMFQASLVSFAILISYQEFDSLLLFYLCELARLENLLIW